jgi:hypothetical protein
MVVLKPQVLRVGLMLAFTLMDLEPVLMEASLKPRSVGSSLHCGTAFVAWHTPVEAILETEAIVVSLDPGLWGFF